MQIPRFSRVWIHKANTFWRRQLTDQHLPVLLSIHPREAEGLHVCIRVISSLGQPLHLRTVVTEIDNWLKAGYVDAYNQARVQVSSFQERNATLAVVNRCVQEHTWMRVAVRDVE